MEEVPVQQLPETSSTPLHPGLDVNRLAVLAREMAMAIQPVEKILNAVGISQAQFEKFILPNAFYKRAYESFVLEWESALSTNKRIALGAAAILEDSLPKLNARMLNDINPLSSVTETAKLFAKLAGAGETKEAVQGERFTITINMGGEKVRIEETIGAVQIPKIIEGESSSTPIQYLPEGESSSTPIRHLPEGQREEHPVQQITTGIPHTK
jgi:hypothetical protein